MLEGVLGICGIENETASDEDHPLEKDLYSLNKTAESQDVINIKTARKLNLCIFLLITIFS